MSLSPATNFHAVMFDTFKDSSDGERRNAYFVESFSGPSFAISYGLVFKEKKPKKSGFVCKVINYQYHSLYNNITVLLSLIMDPLVLFKGVVGLAYNKSILILIP